MQNDDHFSPHSSNPFTNAHKAAERKATADAAAKEVIDMNARLLATEGSIKATKPVQKPYVPAGPWWGPKNG